MYGKSAYALYVLAPGLTNHFPSEFGLAFLDARDRCNAKTRHGTFDTSVLEISSEDLKPFLEALCEEPDGY